MSVSASSVAGDGADKTFMVEMPVTLSSSSSPQKDKAKMPPQKRVDEFWKKFSTKAPGKVTTVLPQNDLASKLAKRKAGGAKGEAHSGITAQASYEEAAAHCKAKVDKIVQECRRVNQKYRDPHFDLEVDLKTGRRDCLESLSNVKYDSCCSDCDSDDDYPIPYVRARGTTRAARRDKTTGSRKIKKEKGKGNQDQPEENKNNLQDGNGAEDSPQGRTPGSRFCPRSVKRVGEIFDDPKFYIDGPTANDVRQGRDGDCWLMAALCTLSNKPGLIEKICVAHNQDVGVYGFVFHRDGEWVSEIIDDKLYLTKPDYDEAISGGVNMERILWEDRERPDSEEIYRKTYQSNSGALYFAQCENPNETWLPLLEKAYAKAHSDYAAIEGGYTGEGIEDLTGGVTSGLFTTDILDKEYFWKEELMKVNQQFLFGCSTGVWGRGWGDRKGIMEGHAYSVMKAVEIDGQRLVLLRNPWGKGEWTGPWSDGSKEWTPEWLTKLDHRFGDDGSFWISYKDLLRKYQAFDRTRLFGPDWKITSIWTTLSVPWTLEYHDTKFAFTLSRAGPVVLVLSQLDDRYFRGLEGQYKFGLGIRVHKAGEDDYLVRAQTAYRMTRSVNVELELEAGDYTVCVKLDARRQDWIKPVEDVIRDNSKNRREKLIRIGLSYDLAHSKARIIETEEEKAAREKYEKRKKDKQRERLRKLIMEEREKNHYLNVKHVTKQRKRIAKRKERQKEKEEKKKAKKAEAEAEAEKKKAKEKEKAEMEKKKAEAALKKKKAEEKEKVETEKKEASDKEKQKETETKEVKVDEVPKGSTPDTKDNDSKSTGDDKQPETKEESQPDRTQTPEPSQSSVGENTPTTSASSKDLFECPETTTPDRNDQVDDKDAHKASGETTIEQSEDSTPKKTEPAPAEGKLAPSIQAAETPTKEADKSNIKEADTSGSALELKPKSEEEKPKPPLSAEVDEKIRKFLGALTDVSNLKTELEALLGGGNKAADGRPPPTHHEHHHHSHHPGDATSSMPYYTPRTHASFAGGVGGGGLPPLPPSTRPLPIPGHTQGHGQAQGQSPPPPPPPPRSETFSSDSDRDEITSVSTLSDLSERELDFHFKENLRQARLAKQQQQQKPGAGTDTPRVPVDAEDDEFEKDPWNAVAVVGLRVYYKVMKGDEEESKGEVVKLRVVRPSLYDLSDEDGKDDGGEEGEGGEKKEGEGNGKDGDGKEDGEEKEDEAKVLDVDDSAKDATSQVVP